MNSLDLSGMINIACGCDDEYARHTSAMLVSALDRLPRDVIKNIFLLHDENLNKDSEKKIIKSLSTYKNVNYKFLFVDEGLMTSLPTKKFHPACWHRIFLPELLPEVGKVLYLDSDMIVVDDLMALWNVDIEECVFGAVVNPLHKFLPPYPIENLGLDSLGEYLNSGCMLMNLNLMRRKKFTIRIKDYAQRNPENLWPEQDAISVVFKKNWLQLHPRWNLQTSFFDLAESDIPIDSTTVIEAKNSPGIIHFTGPHKPWKYICRHPFRELYLQASEKTTWGRLPLEGLSIVTFVFRYFSLRWQLRLRNAMSKYLNITVRI